MAHLLNPNAALTAPTDPSAKLNASLTATYQIRLDHCGYYGTCVVYRKAPGQHVAKVVTHVRAATTVSALTEARRNVRNARKAGGL